MAFLRRRDGGGDAKPPDGAQPPAEQPPAEEPPAYEPPPAEQPTVQHEQPTEVQPPEEQAPAYEEQEQQPAYEEPQAPAVTSEAPPQSEADRQAAAEKVHKDARPQTEEDIPDNIWDQTRHGEEPYKWHSGTKRPHGSTDAIEFIDVKKSFGRNTILNGLNLGVPDDQISMILGPSGTGKSVCIKHMVGLLYPDEGDVLVHGESVPNMQDDELFEMRKKFGVLFQDGAPVRIDEPVRQRRLPAAAAHGQGRGGDQRDLLSTAP